MKQSMEKTMFLPIDLEEFLTGIREIVRQELSKLPKEMPAADNAFQIPNGLMEKPLYKMVEICQLFDITKPTVYDWIRAGRLHPKKLASRLYFMGSDIRKLLEELANQKRTS